jgi:hypothetical protein
MLKPGVIAIKAPLGRAVASQSVRVGDCRLDPVAASPLDREGAYLSRLVADSAPIEIGAVDLIRGKFPVVTAFSFLH